MDFLILGPLEAHDGGRKLPLGGAKQRALLAMLLLHANEVVSSDRLIDALWSDADRKDAANALSVAVARLRKALELGSSGTEDGPIVTRPPGYELRIDETQLDLHRFERLVAEARAETEPAAAAGQLRDALALWRGPPLADLAYESFTQAEIARLEELRQTTLEYRIEADLALGRHDDLIGELEGLTANQPLRERLRAQLMVALYRSGRQAEALEVYADARRTLVEELGIEPGRPLRELHQAILEQDPGLELVATGRSAAEPAPGTPSSIFVGRERELAELVRGLDQAFAGSGRLFLLAGEPGIGKSRLAEELATYARGRGGQVLVGRCWEAGGAPAYWPWMQLLRACVRQSDAEALEAQLGAGAADLAQLVPELRERFPDLPTPPLEPEGARFRLFDAAVGFLRNAADDQPMVLFLDDLHAADGPSLLLLRFLARELGSTRILLLGAYRDLDPVPGEGLTEMLAEVSREPVTNRLSLGGLNAPEVAEYVELAASEVASPELVAELHADTDGNPLFVGEIVRLLAVEGVRAESVGERRLAIPQSVREVIARRVTHLSEECNRVLVLAAVLGREFDHDALAQLSGGARDQLLDTLDEAVVARIVSDVPGAPGRLRFDHVLIRDTLYDGLTSARRVHLHSLAVAAIEELHGEWPGPHVAELARHSIAAGNQEKGVRYARQAAEHALQQLAYEEAARLYRLALEALELTQPVDPIVRGELLLAVGDALTLAGSTADATETFLSAANLARTASLPQLFARAALGYGGRSAWQRAGADGRVIPLLKEALEGLGAEAPLLRARLLARLAGALRDEPSLEPRESHSREAVEIARRAGDDDTLAYTLVGLFMATWGPEIDELVAITEEVSRLVEEAGLAERALDVLTLQGLVAWLTLSESDAEALDQQHSALAGQLKQPVQQWQSEMVNTFWALLRGEFAAAEGLAEEALRSAEGLRSDADCSYRLAMFALRRDQGRLSEIEDLIRSAVHEYPGYRSFPCFIPLLEWELGREDDARRAFDELATDDFAALPRDSEWLFCLSLLAEVAAHLHDGDRASVLYRQLAPYGRINAMASGEVALGPVARYLGILAATTSRWDEAAAHFEDAIAMNARIGARPLLAHTQHDYARMLLQRGQPGDRERARELVAEAIATYRELGMEGWARAAAGEVRA